MSADRVETVVSLCKRRGFVYPSGEIYGGTRSAWDYGPLGVELKANIKREWWRTMVHRREDVVGLDSSVILPQQVWQASGHVSAFHAPLVECTACHHRFRADQLAEEHVARTGGEASQDDLSAVPCPNCAVGGQVHPAARVQHDAADPPRSGRVRRGPALPAAGDGAGHLRELPERARPPRAAGRRSASGRSASRSATRSRRATSSSAPASSSRWRWSTSSSRAPTSSGTGTGSTSGCAGTPTSASGPENLRLHEHPAEKLAHYAKRTVDIEYRFGFGGLEWGELEGIANRTDFDLATHADHSGVDLSYFDQATSSRYRPFVIEPAAGVGRPLMAFLLDAYREDQAPNAKGGMDKRAVLSLDRRLAPVKVAVLPLSRNADLTPKARDIAAVLRHHWNVDFDDAGAIGRRYRRQDEIGTPFCVTVDFDSLHDHAVTVRERDSMTQERVAVDKLERFLAGQLIGC